MTCFLWQVGIFDRDPVSTWTSGVVTLLGDAASPIPPNLGQGGNKAIEDAGVLAASLSRCNGDVAAALKLYEKLRVKRAKDILQYSRQAVRVQNLDSSTSIWLRDNMMRLMVGLNKTIPSDWLWSYDCEREVQQAVLS
jgi:salicylate hydroxylase